MPELAPSRVLMTMDAVGGVWTYGVELAGGLRARGVEVVLAVMGPAPSASQRADAEALGVRVEHAPFRLEWMDDPWRDLEPAGDWLLDLERRHRCDLVHLNGYALATRAFAGPTIVVAHSCVLSWWEAVRGEAAPPEWARYARAVERGLAAATRVVSPTRWMHDAIARLYGASPRASVIYNARAARLRPAAKHPVILGAGRVWDEAKNLVTLARAAHAVSWPIKIAGPLAPPDDGAAAPGPLAGEEERVELLGAVSARDMAELYARASIYALPARYEPFGLTALEAAMSGCALVLGDIPSLRELWDGAAAFVDPGDAGGLARCLEALVRSPDRRHELAARAEARAAQHRHDDMVDAYLRVYAAAALGPAPAARKEPLCVS